MLTKNEIIVILIMWVSTMAKASLVIINVALGLYKGGILMETVQHVGLYAWALLNEFKTPRGVQKFSEVFSRNIPWVLFLDASESMGEAHKASHFEQFSNGVAYMQVPSPESVKESEKLNIPCYIPEGVVSTKVREKIDMDSFWRKNRSHPYRRELGIHLLQDDIINQILKKYIVNTSQAYRDLYYPYTGSAKYMDGKTLQRYIDLWKKKGTLYLVGKILEQTEILMDNNWLEENVLPALQYTFSPSLAEELWRKIRFSEFENSRIKKGGMAFLPTKEECQELETLCDKDFFLGTLDKMYGDAFSATCKAIRGIFE